MGGEGKVWTQEDVDEIEALKARFPDKPPEPAAGEAE